LRLLDQNAMREVALAHEVCPYYLSQEMARWADVVVADYNYYFDFSALLFGLAQANQLESRGVGGRSPQSGGAWSADVQRQPRSIDAQQRAQKRPRGTEKVRCNGSTANGMRCITARSGAYQAYDKAPEKLLQALSSVQREASVTI
jgi:DNA excision repair protein ERCC-2